MQRGTPQDSSRDSIPQAPLLLLPLPTPPPQRNQPHFLLPGPQRTAVQAPSASQAALQLHEASVDGNLTLGVAGWALGLLQPSPGPRAGGISVPIQESLLGEASLRDSCPWPGAGEFRTPCPGPAPPAFRGKPLLGSCHLRSLEEGNWSGPSVRGQLRSRFLFIFFLVLISKLLSLFFRTQLLFFFFYPQLTWKEFVPFAAVLGREPGVGVVPALGLLTFRGRARGGREGQGWQQLR